MHNGVLITRPRHQAGQLALGVTALGAQAMIVPTIEIISPSQSERQAAMDVIEKIADFEIAIFTSPNAVYHGFAMLDSCKLKMPSNIMIAAVGAGTAKVLTQFGVAVSICAPPPFGSENLLAESLFQEVCDKRIIIFSGEGGRNLLQETLQQRGAQAVKVVVYRRGLPKVNRAELKDYFLQKKIDVIICTSNTALINLLTLLNEDKTVLNECVLIGVSERLPFVAEELGLSNQVLVAESASNEAILKTLAIYMENDHESRD